jgi:tetratricopeptide (TPR) repeat protein
MKALKASIRVAVTAIALSLSLGAQSHAGEDEAGTLILQMEELYLAGKYVAALPLAQKSLALLENEFGPDDAKVAMPLVDLGTIHHKLGQYAVAEPFYKRSLAIYEKTRGTDNAYVAMVRKPSRFSSGRSPSAPKRAVLTMCRSCCPWATSPLSTLFRVISTRPCRCFRGDWPSWRRRTALMILKPRS